MTENLINRITYHLSSGGLFNPELADHLAVRNLLMECREALAQPEQEPLNEWSEWRDMVVVNLMRHGNINKDFARRLAHFYQSKAPQRKPLTDEEILDVNMSTVTKLIDEPIICDTDHNIIQFARAIEAAHGIKGEA